MTNDHGARALRDFARWAVQVLGDCRYDSVGVCHAHAFDPPPCPVQVALAVLEGKE